MDSMPPLSSFGWLIVVVAVLLVWTLFFAFRPVVNGDYIDEHVGRGSIEDDWGLEAFDEQ